MECHVYIPIICFETTNCDIGESFKFFLFDQHYILKIWFS